MGRYEEPKPVSLEDSTSNIPRGIAVERRGAFVQIPLSDLNFTTSPIHNIRWCKVVTTRFAIIATPNNNTVRVEELILEIGQAGDYVVQLNDGTLTIISNDMFEEWVK